MKLLADDIFGKIDSSGFAGGGALANDPVGGLAKVIGTAVSLFVVGAGFFLLMYMLWGALDWIISNGEKEKVAKAQSKITNALIGMLLVFGVLVIFGVFTGEILGIVKVTPTGWEIKIPKLN